MTEGTKRYDLEDRTFHFARQDDGKEALSTNI